jgi:hypothetical protein
MLQAFQINKSGINRWTSQEGTKEAPSFRFHKNRMIPEFLMLPFITGTITGIHVNKKVLTYRYISAHIFKTTAPGTWSSIRLPACSITTGITQIENL